MGWRCSGRCATGGTPRRCWCSRPRTRSTSRSRPFARARTTTSPSHSAFEELLARVEALGRRPKEIRAPLLRVGDLELDMATREVKRASERIDLTPKEYTVLEYLMRHTGKVMSRTLITEYAWDYHFDPGTNIVDVVINRLRKKVDSGHAQKLVHTVRGVGYVVKV